MADRDGSHPPSVALFREANELLDAGTETHVFRRCDGRLLVREPAIAAQSVLSRYPSWFVLSVQCRITSETTQGGHRSRGFQEASKNEEGVGESDGIWLSPHTKTLVLLATDATRLDDPRINSPELDGT